MKSYENGKDRCAEMFRGIQKDCCTRNWTRLGESRPEIMCHLYVYKDKVELLLTFVSHWMNADIYVEPQLRALVSPYCLYESKLDHLDNYCSGRWPRFSAVVGFIPARDASKTVQVNATYGKESWTLEVTPYDIVVPFYKATTMAVCYLQYAVSVTCDAKAEDQPMALLAYFSWEVLKELRNMWVLPDLSFSLLMSRPRNEALHKELIEAVWHPKRVLKGLTPEQIFEL